MIKNARNYSLSVCAALSLLALGACAANNPTDLPPGEYSKTVESTNSAGTEIKKTTSTDVYYDRDGNKRAVQNTETSRDPKGFFNKSETETTTTYKR